MCPHTEDGDDQGGQPVGSWHVQDLRGGDLASPEDPNNPQPLTDWRTESGLNADEGSGRHGTYWLLETKSPNGYQLLAQPMQFWVAPNAPSPGGTVYKTWEYYNYQGRLSFPVVGEGEIQASGQEPMPAPPPDATQIRENCESPSVAPAYNQPSCIMPTGWNMQIFNAKMAALPFAGGSPT